MGRMSAPFAMRLTTLTPFPAASISTFFFFTAALLFASLFSTSSFATIIFASPAVLIAFSSSVTVSLISVTTTSLILAAAIIWLDALLGGRRAVGSHECHLYRHHEVVPAHEHARLDISWNFVFALRGRVRYNAVENLGISQPLLTTGDHNGGTHYCR